MGSPGAILAQMKMQKSRQEQQQQQFNSQLMTSGINSFAKAAYAISQQQKQRAHESAMLKQRGEQAKALQAGNLKTKKDYAEWYEKAFPDEHKKARNNAMKTLYEKGKDELTEADRLVLGMPTRKDEIYAASVQQIKLDTAKTANRIQKEDLALKQYKNNPIRRGLKDFGESASGVIDSATGFMKQVGDVADARRKGQPKPLSPEQDYQRRRLAGEVSEEEAGRARGIGFEDGPDAAAKVSTKEAFAAKFIAGEATKEEVEAAGALGYIERDADGKVDPKGAFYVKYMNGEATEEEGRRALRAGWLKEETVEENGFTGRAKELFDLEELKKVAPEAGARLEKWLKSEETAQDLDIQGKRKGLIDKPAAVDPVKDFRGRYLAGEVPEAEATRAKELGLIPANAKSATSAKEDFFVRYMDGGVSPEEQARATSLGWLKGADTQKPPSTQDKFESYAWDVATGAKEVHPGMEAMGVKLGFIRDPKTKAAPTKMSPKMLDAANRAGWKGDGPISDEVWMHALEIRHADDMIERQTGLGEGATATAKLNGAIKLMSTPNYQMAVKLTPEDRQALKTYVMKTYPLMRGSLSAEQRARGDKAIESMNYGVDSGVGLKRGRR